MAIKIGGDTVINDSKEWDDNHLRPSIGGSQNLGSSGQKWKSLWISENIYVNGDTHLDSNITQIDTEGLITIAGEVTINNNLTVNGSGSGYGITANTLRVIGTASFEGNTYLGNGYGDDIYVRGTLVNQGDLIKVEDANVRLDGDAYISTRLGSNTYCPVLASTWNVRNSGGYKTCQGVSGDYSPTPASGVADSNGWIGHYTVVGSGNNLYFSHCYLYDIACLNDGHEPAYMYNEPGDWYGYGGVE